MKLTTTILILFVCFGCKIRESKASSTYKAKSITVNSTGRIADGQQYDSMFSGNAITTTGTLTINYDDYAKDTPVTGYLSSEDFKRFVSKQKAYTDETIDKYDTQKVIMLVSDHVIHKESYLQPYLQYGYKVISKHGTGEIEYSYEDGKAVPYPVYDYDFVNYLDADKKPLPKSIIVWQTKELK